MFFPFRIARRYLFSNKTTNAINIITGISVFGLSIGTAAIILVLSVFNGFEDLISDLFSDFNPDVKILPVQGKVFSPEIDMIKKLNALPDVIAVSKTIEEIGIFGYKRSQDYGTLKGVDQYYQTVTELDSTIREGGYQLQNQKKEFAILGIGMRNKLSVNIDDVFSPITVYMPKKGKSKLLEKSFNTGFVYPKATFVIQQEFDNKYIISSLEFAQKVIGSKGEISALEVRLKENHNHEKVMASIQEIVGDQLIAKDRYQQEASFLKLMNIEKWMGFAILCLIIILVAFNMIGTLWMIVLDKRKDIAILKSMGVNNKDIKNIFLGVGILLTLLGVAIGILLALILYFIQINYGIVPIPEGFVIASYPISLRFSDIVLISLTVMTIGFLASLAPAFRAKSVPTVYHSGA